MAECIAPFSNETLELHEHQKDSSAIRTFPDTTLLKQDLTSTVDPHDSKYFDNSEAADYAFAETASPMRISNASSDRRVSRYWIAFQLQILWAYPIHPVAILLSGPHAFQFLWLATIFLTCSIFSAILSFVFKLKNKQAAAEMSLFVAGAIVVTYSDSGIQYTFEEERRIELVKEDPLNIFPPGTICDHVAVMTGKIDDFAKKSCPQVRSLRPTL
ncbi:hypothetical protein CVT25_009966 [Psilocybe cyanescens]|uniref:Uncharacterized protein n=1 Tax=Psilocybe cyanescens TaxID=93625 RepID=A0A409XCW2_PSICY|nr:hypothetical protein CVT25_009966 [Psilocybe cyanescens]